MFISNPVSIGMCCSSLHSYIPCTKIVQYNIEVYILVYYMCIVYTLVSQIERQVQGQKQRFRLTPS